MDQKEFKEMFFRKIRSSYERYKNSFVPHLAILSYRDLRGNVYDEPGVTLLLIDPEVFATRENAGVAYQFVKDKARELQAISVGYVTTATYHVETNESDRGYAIKAVYQNRGEPTEFWAAIITDGFGALQEFKPVEVVGDPKEAELLPEVSREEMN